MSLMSKTTNDEVKIRNQMTVSTRSISKHEHGKFTATQFQLQIFCKIYFRYSKGKTIELLRSDLNHIRWKYI